MALITACPACHTQFEITPLELAAHAGLVRCGACQTVFDANSQLRTITDDSHAEPPSNRAETTEIPVTHREASADWSATEASQAEQAPGHANMEAMLQADAALSDAAASEADSAALATLVDAHNAQDDPDLSGARAAPQPDSDSSNTLSMPAITADEVPNLPAFLTQTPTVAQQRSRISKVILGLVIVIGTLAALGQALYLYRMPLLASYPALQPWLVRFCAPLDCHLTWPKEIAALAMDDVDVQEHPERDQVLVFSSLLINHGTTTVALPNIELTLTDANDTPLVRRQLTPQMYLPATMQASNGIAAKQTIEVRLLLAVKQTGVAGFHASIAY